MLLNAITAGEGAPVALLHGLFGAAANLGPVARLLAPHYRVIALDLRNHGASPHAAAMDYGLMADDVRDTLIAMAAWPAALVGHSMGGKTAMRLALAAREVVKLAVLDIAPVPYEAKLGVYAQAMRAIPPASTLTRQEADRRLADAVPEPGVRAFLLQNLRLGEDAGWRIGLDAIAAAMPALEGWEAPPTSRYDGPTLFAAGERSAYIQQSAMPAIRALFPQARFETVRNAGHWLHADNPGATATLVREFLNA